MPRVPASSTRLQPIGTAQLANAGVWGKTAGVAIISEIDLNA